MDNKLFISEIIRPLSKNLKVNIYLNTNYLRNDWNENCPKVNKGEKCHGCQGTCKCDENGRRICLSLPKKTSELIGNLFHEVGHATMHNIYNSYEKNPIFCEAEAEEFAKAMCKKIEIPYNPNFRDAPDVNFINYFWNLYSDYCDENGLKVSTIRYELIDKITNDILSYNLNYKKFL